MATYSNYVYYPSSYKELPTALVDLTYINKNCAPMCYSYSKDFQKIVDYLKIQNVLKIASFLMAFTSQEAIYRVNTQ